MELLQLRYFRTAARMESITSAARFHRIPQPAMSQCIARLEHELGDVKLFDRRHNRIFLNDAGKRFLEYVERSLAALDDGISAVTTAGKPLSGTISLLVLENRRFVLQCVSQFADLHPDISFSISHDAYSMQNVDYDLCISTTPVSNTSRPLIQEPIVLAVHEKHPLANCGAVELSQLKEEKFITMPAHSSLAALLREACREAGFEPNIPYVCDDPYFIRKYVSLSMGVAIAPAISWAGRFRENTVLLNIRHPSLTTLSHVSWNPGRFLSPAVSAFREYLLEEAGTVQGNLVSPGITKDRA